MLKKTLGRGSEDQKGFTLIELLVVVGIIVALAAVVVPLVIQFSGRGDAGAASAEWDAIQSAIDTMMSDVGLTVLSGSPSTNLHITRVLDLDGAGATLASYMRDGSTTYCYTWDSSGRITDQVTATSPTVCPS
jgi:prepilin-type N-terminal cleavage/methylation domain-containing protein